MCRTGICRFGIKNWIFLFVCLHLFTYAQGNGDQDPGIRFTAEPSDLVVGAGRPALLACAVSSRRAARLAWRHNVGAMPTRDHQLSADDKYRKQLTNGSLQITSMSSALAGQYQCVARVEGVGTVVSRVASVLVAAVPTLGGGARSVLGAAGGVALLACAWKVSPRVAPRVVNAAAADRRVYGAARLHAAPPALLLNVTWQLNGSPVSVTGARVSLTPSGALELDPLRPHDAGLYRCRVALHHDPTDYKLGDEIELRVSSEVASVESPPRFIATPQPLTVMEGASVTFDCAATGNPKPEITWLNNGVAIDLSDLDSRFYLVGSGSLRVQWARALDAGAYTCRAHSRLDSADHTAQLLVLSPPRVTTPAAVRTARPRADVTLPCEAKGRPPPAVTWLKDGDVLTPNNRDLALLDGGSLRILGVLSVDAGMFQCAATSPAGAAVGTIRLLLAPEPHPPNTSLPHPSNLTHDIFSTLVSQDTSYPSSEDTFLGETSPAYTPTPDVDYDEYDFHAAEGEEAPEDGNATVLPPPKDLKAVIVKHRFVTLSWEPPDGDDVTGYVVTYRVKGSERERVWVSGGNRRETNVAGLQPDTTYCFTVRATHRHHTSPPSQTVEVRTAGEESPGARLAVRAEALGPHAARLVWPAPAPAPHNYTIHYTETESGRSQFLVISVDPAASSVSHTISGLRAAAHYRVGVAAAAGGPAGDTTLSTPSAPPSAPPGNVSAAAAGHNALAVRWDPPPPASHGGPLTGYKVRYRAAPATGPRRKADSLTTPANARRAELRDLDTATTYQVRVSALNANGSGPFSEWVSAATRAHLPDETRVPPQPPPLTTRAGRDWISVWWQGGGGDTAVRGYELGWGRGVPDETSRSLPPAAHSHVIRHLEPNTEYVISLRASNAQGLGPAVYGTVRTRAPPAEGDDLADTPGDLDGEGDGEEDDGEDEEEDVAPLIPPVGLKVIMLSGTTAVVYWTDPTLPKGQGATDGRRYVVRWAAAGAAGGGAGGGSGGGGRPRYFNATDLNCMLDDLKPHTLYEFSVKLIKGGRESAWSMLVSNSTLEAAPATAPRELRVTGAGPRAADLAWQPPARPNGLITGYVIMYAIASGAGGEEWVAVAAAGDRGRARVDRLRPRTTYVFKVQARNARGLGPFTPPAHYTTPLEGGEGGGLASATSAWLWASAGGACAVLALAAALALSLCWGRARPPSPQPPTYHKAAAAAALKPPDLWIHHDQMELKHIDKPLHTSASKISGGSAETSSALVSSTLTLARAPPAEYEPARHHAPASLDRRHLVPTYVERVSPRTDSEASSRASPACAPLHCTCDYTSYKPMTGMGVGVGVGGVGCSATCDRRPHRPHHDQSTPLVSGVGPLSSPQSLSSLAHLPHHLPHHPPPPPCGSGSCPLGAACAGGGGGTGGGGGGGNVPGAGGDIYACAARERGHYVAYEPLGHYTQDSVSSEAGGGGGSVGAGAGAGGGSLQRRACAAALHSFALDAASDHSTPSHSHSRGSVRETSPYKKSASSSPGHIPNRLQLGGAVSQCAEELEPLTPSRSTERLHREMQNLEGLMKDLSAITQHQFHC